MASTLPTYSIMFVALCAACSEQAVSDANQSTTVQIGDTTVVRTHGSRATERMDSITIVWQSADLDRPRLIWPLEEHLVVVDRTRLHVLSLRGEYLRTIGREGAGPGELRAVAAVGSARGDTLLVHDAALQRVSFFTADGVLRREVPATPRAPFVNPVVASGLVIQRGGIFSFWEENLQQERPTRTALIWRDLTADTAAVVETWTGATWSRIGDFVVQDPLFGPQAIVAMSPKSEFAVGTGVDDCITILRPSEPAILQVCRDYDRLRIGPGIRRPDLSRVESDGRRAAIAALLREQRIADRFPSYDRLLLDNDGRLWVRTTAPEQAAVHPYVRRYFPELEPAYRVWDAYERSGRMLGSLEVPARFNPYVILSNGMIGLFELESGEIVVAVGTVPFL